VLLNVEPEFDTADPAQALAALNQAEMVVVMSPFKHGVDYADVLLPIAPFTETSGTFVNAEGTCRASTAWCARWATRARLEGAARAGQPARPAGLRLRDGRRSARAALATQVSRAACRTARGRAGTCAASAANGGFERLADVPIYHADALVRRAGALHLTAAARPRTPSACRPGCSTSWA
jgi:NADH-quinone oxidoreductase subunit G